ncbi:hypothetical protein [Pseudoalteromonas peptidolytica]|uniref:Uncharacterized protein n=1 Tax=Pseudoalteromonas peptidolytica F12-50-A1 TaxID=1315280 RepID=A0A8I0MVT6_9GAMM|nr:hypothetical protein [Pseudoalteromonas peptidolytica]MBE0346079.1 hypothetical protein [Pseudoalteromonas peptidolytica F12-50-A1]NLR17098.1 hypothetical protein [Pseudoalteromonas peptidolytica]
MVYLKLVVGVFGLPLVYLGLLPGLLLFILDSSAAHQEQMMQLLSDPSKAAQFARVVFDMLNGLKG